MDVKLWGFEELYEFYNCLTIYFILWLRDILVVCRSGYRSGLLNCVGILYNFGVIKKEVNNLDSGRWIWSWRVSGTHTQDLAAGT